MRLAEMKILKADHDNEAIGILMEVGDAQKCEDNSSCGQAIAWPRVSGVVPSAFIRTDWP
jgi:hypothetical protein